MRKVTRLWPIFLIILLVLAGCPPRATWRQELAMTFDTPSGPLRLASVQQVSFVGNIRWMREFDRSRSKIEGEAVVADLGGTVLYLLLEGVDDLLYNTLRQTGRIDTAYRDSLSAIRAQTEPLVVPQPLYPMIVTFSDPADPRSVTQVVPDDIAALAGDGYALRAITIRRTTDPVTKGLIAARLPWTTDPTWRQNPIWATLPHIVQRTISFMRKSPK